MKSLASKGLASEVYNWGYYYYVINEKGVAHLKEYLGVTDERVKPETFKQKADAQTASNAREGGRVARGGRVGTRGGRVGGEGETEAKTEEAQEE